MERYRQYLDALAEISRTIHEGVAPDRLMTAILHPLVSLFNAKGGSLRSVNRRSGELELRAATGLSAHYLQKGPVSADPDHSEVYDDGLVVIHRVDTDPRVQYPQAAMDEGIITIVSLPFAIVGDERMVLRIYLDRPLDPAAADLQILHSLAQQGVVLIRNSLVHLRYFDTLRSVNTALHKGEDTPAILKGIVSHVAEVMGARGAIYWIVNSSAERIEAKVSAGFAYEGLQAVDYTHLKQIFDWECQRLVFIPDARAEQRIPSLERLGKKRIVTLLGMPFAITEPYHGILAVYFGRQRDLTASELHFLNALGEQGALALQKALRYDERMLRAFRETIEGLVLALEAKDPVTHGHSRRVSVMARGVAEELGLTTHEIDTICHAALLHDIGKIGLGDRILTRTGKLSRSEMDNMRQHPEIGAGILRPLSFLAEVVPLVLHHHERFDGSGYPGGLSGEQIPMGARVIAACDAFETMIAGRPSLPSRSLAEALRTMQEASGKGFAPPVVQALLSALRRDPQLVGDAESVCAFFANDQPTHDPTSAYPFHTFLPGF